MQTSIALLAKPLIAEPSGSNQKNSGGGEAKPAFFDLFTITGPVADEDDSQLRQQRQDGAAMAAMIGPGPASFVAPANAFGHPSVSGPQEALPATAVLAETDQRTDKVRLPAALAPRQGSGGVESGIIPSMPGWPEGRESGGPGKSAPHLAEEENERPGGKSPALVPADGATAGEMAAPPIARTVGQPNEPGGAAGHGVDAADAQGSPDMQWMPMSARSLSAQKALAASGASPAQATRQIPTLTTMQFAEGSQVIPAQPTATRADASQMSPPGAWPRLPDPSALAGVAAPHGWALSGEQGTARGFVISQDAAKGGLPPSGSAVTFAPPTAQERMNPAGDGVRLRRSSGLETLPFQPQPSSSVIKGRIRVVEQLQTRNLEPPGPAGQPVAQIGTEVVNRIGPTTRGAAPGEAYAPVDKVVAAFAADGGSRRASGPISNPGTPAPEARAGPNTTSPSPPREAIPSTWQMPDWRGEPPVRAAAVSQMGNPELARQAGIPLQHEAPGTVSARESGAPAANLFAAKDGIRADILAGKKTAAPEQGGGTYLQAERAGDAGATSRPDAGAPDRMRSEMPAVKPSPVGPQTGLRNPVGDTAYAPLPAGGGDDLPLALAETSLGVRGVSGSGGAHVPPSEPALARHIASQIAELARRPAHAPLEIALSPEELGRVRLILTQDQGALNVSVVAERAETQDLMRRHIETLAQDLRAIGYRDVSFSFGSGGGARSRQGSGDASPVPGEPEASPQPVRETEAALPSMGASSPSAAIPDRVDIRL